MRKLSKETISLFSKRAIVSLASVAMVATMSLSTVSVSPVKGATASSTLVWSDEFNGNSLDTSKWTYEIGTGSSGWGNNELEYYTNRNDNVSVYDGALHITAKREDYNGKNYTSGRIKTESKFYFTYGHIEARIAIPSCTGIWPAFWMLGQNIGSVGWPSCGETDIMEAVNTENKVYGTLHWNANGHAEYSNSTGNYDITQYHIYTCDWDSQYIRMYVDGNKYQEVYIGNNAGETDEFHKPFFFLFNVAVGGNWPGFSVNDSAFPQTMLVDYIRVYQDTPNFVSTSSNSVDSGSSSGNTGSSSGNSGSSSSGNTGTSGSTGATSNTGMGMTDNGNGTATAYVNDSSWADIHYAINNGGQQNVRMTQNGTKATYNISGLNKGDVVKYWFTYSNTNGYVKDTSSQTFTYGLGNASSSGSSSGSGNTGSSSGNVNSSSGDVYIYQDINYGGNSASLGVGNYTLSSLQAKGFKNDDLSSIKVPFGYKVTLYDNDNFGGESMVVTADTNWIGTAFNDRVSSIKVEKARYKIINKHSGLCLDVAGADKASGTNVQQCQANGNIAQEWELDYNNDDSTYIIKSALTGKALDMDGWSQDNGGNAIIWDNNKTANQRWYVTWVDDGYVFFINKHSNKSLEVGGWSTSNGGNVQQWDYKAQANQLWKFEMVN